MLLDECSFETNRLTVASWQFQSLRYGRLEDRGLEMASLLTGAVTQGLPSGWQGEFDRTRGEAWLDQREAEGLVLFAVEPGLAEIVGLMLLFESDVEVSVGVDVRIGYVVSEGAWGKGFASELVAGFVDWCRSQPLIRSLVGGVDRRNAASIRVLEKSGFVRDVTTGDDTNELEFILNLRPESRT